MLRIVSFAIIVVAAATPQTDAQGLTWLERPGDSANDRFGGAVAGLGDVNGDGIGDIAVGARLDDDGASSGGVLHILSGDDGSVIDTIAGPVAAGELGTAVDAIGDLDGDGITEIVVGADGDNTAGPQAGSVRVVSGATRAVLHHLFGPGTSRFGASVTGGGDVDGDGCPDFVVGAPLADVGGVNSGCAYVYSGATGQELHAFHGDTGDEAAGAAVAICDDFTGDGLAEILVGYPEADESAFDDGRARVFCGATGALLHDLDSGSGQNSSNFGRTVASLDDLNGDGIGEFAVGAPSEVIMTGGGIGRVRIYSGATGAQIRLVEINVNTVNSLGASLANAGDVDGDGVGDYVIGSPLDNLPGMSFVGMSYLYSGATGALVHTRNGNATGDRFGSSVGSAGDINGDGFQEVIVGSPLADPSGGESGLAHVLGASGTRAYDGTLGALQPLALDWLPSPAPAVGQFACAGAAPFAAGLLFVSALPADFTIGNPPVPILFDPGTIILLLNITFQGDGTWTAPGNLSFAAIAGVSVFLQAFDLAGYAAASNGLRIVFAP